jgi:ABC-type lipoprotein export system ATPase subunit
VNAVETHDLFRIYAGDGAAAALQGLTLTVREGEVVVVFGPSGSGKTTLLRILAALDRPSAGSVDVLGHDLRTLGGGRLREYRSRVLGYVDQHYARSLAPELRVRELVALRLALLGEPRSSRLRRADELLERIGLAERRDAYARKLSGGQQQRVALAAAIAHRPRLLLADEPTGELDAANAARAFALIGELVRENGATAVIVSHDPRSAEVADRVIHVRDGRVSAESVRERAHAEEIVLGRGGWVRLPEELLRRARIGERATARAEGDAVVIASTRADTPEAPAPPAPIRPLAPPTVVAEVRSVVKDYAGARVLDGLDATFQGGRLTAVTGPSGSGKTTLLHLLSGIDTPTAGEVVVAGSSLSHLDGDERARLRRETIALVAQDAGLLPVLSARENVELALELRGQHGDTERALAAVGLADLADQRVANLSTGERQRVALARAIAARPALLLADEPTARLDEANARAIALLFARLAAELGTAVVCATHDPVVIEQAHAELPLAAAAPDEGRDATLVARR